MISAKTIEKQMRNESVNYYVGALEQVDNPEIEPQIKIWESKVIKYMKEDMLTKKQLKRVMAAIYKYESLKFAEALKCDPRKIYKGTI
jgi:uridine kinase